MDEKMIFIEREFKIRERKNRKMTTHQKHFGQYFTTNSILKRKVYEFIQNHADCILEPSCGRGDLVMAVLKHRPDQEFHLYEIDEKIKLLEPLDREMVIWGDFLEIEKTRKYATIIGNPPYVSRPRKCNLYIEFIKVCFDLLEEDGEMIMIVPSEVFQLTSTAKLMNEMMMRGSFTHIYHPHDENLFEGASVDVLIFRYQKTEGLENRVLYNGNVKMIQNKDGLLTFVDEIVEERVMGDFFDVYVGIVSGKEEVYKNSELGNVDVINGEGVIDRYILLDQFPTGSSDVDEYMMKYKKVLIERKIRNFTEKNWWEWGALRNTKVMRDHEGEDCIYVMTLTRKHKVAFRGKIGYFGGGLLMMRPKSEEVDLDKFVNFINSEEFRKHHLFSGRFKISHRQLVYSSS
jgi:adenine-specific DNA-methyltransferase